MLYVSGELSSISGSESDSDDSVQVDSTHQSSSPFLYFMSGDCRTVYSVYRAAVAGGKVCSVVWLRLFLTHSLLLQESTLSASLLLSLTHPPLWVVLMQAGGHFAGAVFSGCVSLRYGVVYVYVMYATNCCSPNVLLHKTFHRYTVRAKRGTSQSVRDAQSGGHGPR